MIPMVLLACVLPSCTTGHSGAVSEQQAQQQHVAELVACGLVDPLAAPCPDPWVTTVLELPRVTVGESLLTARTLGPSQVTAGMPFTYSLQVSFALGCTVQ